MNRSPYRRVMPSRRAGAGYSSGHSAGDESISHGETLIFQCIICGIIMVFVLIAGMVDIAPAVRLREGMRQVLSGAQTLDELVMEVRQFGHQWLDWAPPPETAATPAELYIPEIDSLYPSPSYNLEQTIFPSTSYPNTEHLPPAAIDQVSNPAVPEPPVTPGLRE